MQQVVHDPPLNIARILVRVPKCGKGEFQIFR